MAKVKSGGIRNLIGRVGGNVYYMNKGQNIARELAPAISNPQTAAQQEQRMRWANLVSFYRANQPWQKRGAFESKKQTWSDYNAFVSANSKISPVFLTKGEAEQGGAVVAPYIVTKGSLPSVGLFSWEGQDVFCSDLYVGDLTISGTTTAAQLSAALRENNNGLQEGDQLSFILNIQGTSAEGVPFITARYYEFIIDSSDNRTLADIGLEGVIIADEYEEMQRICLAHDGAVCGGAIIVSRTISGNIKVSTQSLVLTVSMETFLAGYTSDAALQRAARSYGENEANFLAAGYSGKASNVAVPTAQSLLYLQVGDVQVTDVARQIGTNDNFGDTTPYILVAHFAQPVSEVTAAEFSLTGTTDPPLQAMPVTITGNEVRLTGSYFNSALGHVNVSGFSITADGVEYTL